MEQPAQRRPLAGGCASPVAVGNPNGATKPRPAWPDIFWVTPTPVQLRTREALAYVTIIGSAALATADERVLALADGALQRGDTICQLDGHAPAIQWDHLGPPRSIEELATRLVYGHVADVVMRAAHQCQDLSQVRSQARKLAKEARLWVTPALAVLGLRLDGLTIDRLEDDSRWEHEA